MYIPQAHVAAGVAKDTDSAAIAATMATSQNGLNSLLNFKPLLTSINRYFPFQLVVSSFSFIFGLVIDDISTAYDSQGIPEPLDP